MQAFINPFKFEDIIRKGRAVLISCTFGVESTKSTFTIAEILMRINLLRSQGYPDISMAQELLAIKEASREIARDDWSLDPNSI